MDFFICCIIFGIIAGAIWLLGLFLRTLFNNTFIITAIIDFIVVCLAGYLFLYCVFTYNNGELRLYEIVGFLLGFSILLLSFGKIVAKLSKLIYNYIQKFDQRFGSKKEKQPCKKNKQCSS